MTTEQKTKKDLGAQSLNRDNVSYRLVGADGKFKKLFALNSLGQKVLRFVRSKVEKPIGSDGRVKPGVLNHLAAYGVRIPFITGGWVDELKVANLMTNAGLAGLAGRMAGGSAAGVFDVIGVGTGTTAANAADTTLEAEIADSGLAKAQGTVSLVTTTVTNDTNQVTKTFSVSGSKAVTESGLLNATPTLLCRQTFSAINVVSGDSLQMTWKVKCA